MSEENVFRESLMAHDWPGRVSVEDLYQAFKKRMMAEIVASRTLRVADNGPIMTQEFLKLVDAP